jgi:hypothetical protein
MPLAGEFAGRGTSFSFQSASATAAPDSANALAVARPSPDAAPVTSATLFSNEMFMCISPVVVLPIESVLHGDMSLPTYPRVVSFAVSLLSRSCRFFA